MLHFLNTGINTFFDVSGILEWPLLYLLHLRVIQDQPASFINTQHIRYIFSMYNVVFQLTTHITHIQDLHKIAGSIGTI